MTEKQRCQMVTTYFLLHKHSKHLQINNTATWLLVMGFAETCEFKSLKMWSRHR